MLKYIYKGKENEKVPCNATNVEIESTVKIIREKAFSQCESLIHVDIPPSVEIIEGYAFCLCSSLTCVSMTSSVKHIGKCAFLFCFSLTKIDISPSIIVIDESAFQFCISLAHIDFYPMIKREVSYDKLHKECTKSESQIIINNQTIFISRLRSLFHLIYHTFVFIIGKILHTTKSSNMSNSSNLSNLSNSSDVIPSIQNEQIILIKSSVKSIKRCAFYGCASLITVDIPPSVQNIEKDAFNNCTSLEKIYLHKKCIYDCTSFTSSTQLIHAWYDVGPLIYLRYLVQMKRAFPLDINDDNLFIIQFFITSTNDDIFRTILEYLIYNIIHIDQSENLIYYQDEQESHVSVESETSNESEMSDEVQSLQ